MPINFDGLHGKHGLLHAAQWRNGALQNTIITSQTQSGNLFENKERKEKIVCDTPCGPKIRNFQAFLPQGTHSNNND